MKEIIYAIQVHILISSGLRVLDVKIGKTSNINSILAQYKRSARNIEILNLWESNKDLRLSDCEQGIHKLAEQYAYERDSEKFIFLQKSYDDFAKNVSFLLKQTTKKELSEYGRSKNKEGNIDEEKGIKINAKFFPCKYARDILINTANFLIKEGKIKESDLPIKAGKKRYLINKTGMHPNGKKFFDMKKLDSGYYLESNMNTKGIITKAKGLLKKFGYSGNDLELIGF